MSCNSEGIWAQASLTLHIILCAKKISQHLKNPGFHEPICRLVFNPNKVDVSVCPITILSQNQSFMKLKPWGILQGVYLRISTKTANLGSKMMLAAKLQQFLLPKNPMLHKSPVAPRSGSASCCFAWFSCLRLFAGLHHLIDLICR